MKGLIPRYRAAMLAGIAVSTLRKLADDSGSTIHPSRLITVALVLA
jgi:hypothetical protein